MGGYVHCQIKMLFKSKQEAVILNLQGGQLHCIKCIVDSFIARLFRMFNCPTVYDSANL